MAAKPLRSDQSTADAGQRCGDGLQVQSGLAGRSARARGVPGSSALLLLVVGAGSLLPCPKAHSDRVAVASAAGYWAPRTHGPAQQACDRKGSQGSTPGPPWGRLPAGSDRRTTCS